MKTLLAVLALSLVFVAPAEAKKAKKAVPAPTIAGCLYDYPYWALVAFCSNSN